MLPQTPTSLPKTFLLALLTVCLGIGNLGAEENSDLKVTVQGKSSEGTLTLALEVNQGEDARPLKAVLVRSMPSERLLLVQWNPEDIGETLRGEVETGKPATLVESPIGSSAPRITISFEPKDDFGLSIEGVFADGHREILSAAKVDLAKFQFETTSSYPKTE